MTIFDKNVNPIFFVSQDYEYFLFKINVNYIEWKQLRLIWIAFYKNDDNDKCLIKIISKDSIKHIITFLAPIKSIGSDSNILYV